MPEQKAEKERQQTLLEELCGADEALYSVLSSYLYHTPLAAISKEDLDALVTEAEESGDFRLAVDKAIFEGSQNPGQRERYVEVIRSIASKAVHAAERAMEQREREGFADRAASFGKKIEDYRFMSDRAGDVLAVSSKYYSERLLESEESTRREERHERRKQFEGEERAIGEREKDERAARKRARRKLSRRERREARREERTANAAAEDRRKAREEERSKEEEEERRQEELEKAARDERTRERRGD